MGRSRSGGGGSGGKGKGKGSGGPNRVIVQQRPDKKWEATKPAAKRASAVTNTQKEAQDRGRAILKNEGGGELTTKGRGGKIRDSDTVAPGNDPNPPKDKK